MPHAVLLGDSIFDNAAYVPGGPSVSEQLRALLPPGWQVTLLAIDGDVTAGVVRQLQDVPADATHLLVSCGGNDALTQIDMLSERVSSVADAMRRASETRESFRRDYRRMLGALQSAGQTFACCTIYDRIPGLGPEALTALALYNEVILREAVAANAAVIDLRVICSEFEDYSELSPIEPSEKGGAKIAAALTRFLLGEAAPRGMVGVWR